MKMLWLKLKQAAKFIKQEVEFYRETANVIDGVLAGVTVLLAAFKVLGVIDISWWIVFSPIIAVAVAVLFIMLAVKWMLVYEKR